MKFHVEQKELARAVKALNKCLNRRPHLPVLGGIYAQLTGQTLILTAMDLTAGVRVKLPVVSDGDGAVVLTGKNFVEAVGFFDQEQTNFELQEREMIVKNGRDRVKIPLIDEDYLPLTLATQETLGERQPVAFWTEIVKKVAYAASADQSRPALTGILLKATGEQLQVVCTDGFRLAIWRTKARLTSEEELEVIVAAKALSDVTTIADILGEEKISFIYQPAAEQVWLGGERFEFFTKLINAAYPPFEKIVPLEFTSETTLVREEWVHNLSKASVFTKADSHTVKMSIGESAVDFTATSLGDGSFQGQQEIVKQVGAGLDISFNIKYLLDFLNTLTCETVWLGCNGPTAPAVIKDPADETMIYIAMPFKPKN